MGNITENDHIFWVFGETYLDFQNAYLRFENVKYYPRIEIKMNKENIDNELQTFDLIIYHGVFDRYLIDFFSRHKAILRKLVLYFWGGDKEEPQKWEDRVRKKFVIRNAAAIVTIIPQDFQDLKKKYHPKGKHFCAKYNIDHAFGIADRILKLPVKRENTINIQVGNSATETNNHLALFDILGKYRSDRIKIYAPLSYGNMDYADRVIECGKEIFGDKFVPIQKMMSLEEYYLHLNKMDVGVFAMKRQQALGNINTMMKFGCKIFLCRESLLWEYYAQNLECTISDIKEIPQMTIKEFARFSEDEKIHNRKQIQLNNRTESTIESWRYIFNSI